MNVDEALVILDAFLDRGLNDIQELVFRKAWEGQTYPEIAESSDYDANYIKDVGSKLWKLLSKALSEEVTKSNFRAVLRRRASELGSRENSEFGIRNSEFGIPNSKFSTRLSPLASRLSPTTNYQLPITHIDWGEAVDIATFYGRSEELATLEQWIKNDSPRGDSSASRCRLVAVLGMGGMGKTALSIALAENLQSEFEYIVWRSLRNAPPLAELLGGIVQFLSHQQETAATLSQDLDRCISMLLEYLRHHRCLLVLDNVESILRGGEHAGQYREGYQAYGELLQRIGEVRHTSCLVLTSREKPKEIVLLEGETLPVRSLQLEGLNIAAGREIFRAKGNFVGSDLEWQRLIEHYAGNPLALKMVAAGIQDLFDSNLTIFLATLRTGTLVFDDIRDLLERQMNRISKLEIEVMYWLAVEREPIAFTALRENVLSLEAKQKLPETLRSLGQRSLIEKTATGFTQQPVVMDFAIDRFIERICGEIVRGAIGLFNSHAILEAQAKDYIRDTQIRLIIIPLVDKLLAQTNLSSLVDRLGQILTNWRQRSARSPGYLAGNILNLLTHLKIDLRGWDFSNLCVWQAYLAGRNLKQVNFARADLAKSVFTEDLSVTPAVAFSPTGKLLATGDADGAIRLWQVADWKKLLTLKGHTNWIWSVMFNPDGSVLASASDDKTVRLWDTRSGECRCILPHTHRIWSVAFSPDGKTIASGSEDSTVKLWHWQTGECYQTLFGHTNWIRSIAFSPDGKTLASGSVDCTVRLWDVGTGECIKTLQGHTTQVWSVAFSPDGEMLASSSDRTVKLWQTSTGECLRTLCGHTNWIRTVAFSSGGDIVASGSEDYTIRLWDVQTGECCRTLAGHTNWIRSVAFSPDGKTLASGSGDHTIKIWNVTDGKCIKTLQGYTSRVWSVAFHPRPLASHPTGMLASGNDDKTVRLWNVETGECDRTLHGHGNRVWAVAFSPDGQTIASGSGDYTIGLWNASTSDRYNTIQAYSGVRSLAFHPNGYILAGGCDDYTVRLWDILSGKTLHKLQGHTNRVWSVAFSVDGNFLASGSDDHTIKLWNTETGECHNTLQGHDNWVWAVAFSPDGQTLASGSGDRTVKLWDWQTGKCYQTLQEHTSRVWSVAFSPDGQTVASGSSDYSIKLWNVETGECRHTLQGHTDLIWSVAFSTDGQILASGSQDETIRLWDANTGKSLKILRAQRPYEGMNIAGVTGLTEAAIATLKALGATEWVMGNG
jgi:WD40 repeat protein